MHQSRTATAESAGALLSAIAIGILSPPAIAADSPAAARSETAPVKHLRVLAIGNSFSAQTVQQLNGLVAAAPGCRITLAHALINGSSIEMHVVAADAFEKGPKDPKGRPYPGNVSLHELLKKERWDFVTFQQLSGLSYDVNSFRPWAKRLYDYVRTHAPQAEVVMHQTWAYREDDPQFSGPKWNADLMYRRVRLAYDAVAGELNCRLIRTGDAFQMARLDPVWRFDPAKAKVNPAAFTYPGLPEQEHSLHAGWRWSRKPDGSQVLVNDTHHASTAGAYLAGCVWFEFFFGRSVVGNTYLPDKVSKEDTAFLQTVADRVVTKNERPPLPADTSGAKAK